jgi:heme exporter protein B
MKRDLALAYQSGSGPVLGLVFYLCLVILFPFGIGPNMKTLSLVSPAIIWAGPLLSILLGVEKVFQPDVDDGSFDIYRLSAVPLEIIILTKAVTFWIAAALPLIALSPFFAMLLAMESDVILGSLLALLIGSPALVFFGVFCAALTVKLKRAGLLIVILAVPFLVPVMIFGVSASRNLSANGPLSAASFYYLAALSIFSGLLCCLAGARALK